MKRNVKRQDDEGKGRAHRRTKTAKKQGLSRQKGKQGNGGQGGGCLGVVAKKKGVRKQERQRTARRHGDEEIDKKGTKGCPPKKSCFSRKRDEGGEPSHEQEDAKSRKKTGTQRKAVLLLPSHMPRGRRCTSRSDTQWSVEDSGRKDSLPCTYSRKRKQRVSLTLECCGGDTKQGQEERCIKGEEEKADQEGEKEKGNRRRDVKRRVSACSSLSETQQAGGAARLPREDGQEWDREGHAGTAPTRRGSRRKKTKVVGRQSSFKSLVSQRRKLGQQRDRGGGVEEEKCRTQGLVSQLRREEQEEQNKTGGGGSASSVESPQKPTAEGGINLHHTSVPLDKDPVSPGFPARRGGIQESHSQSEGDQEEEEGGGEGERGEVDAGEQASGEEQEEVGAAPEAGVACESEGSLSCCELCFRHHVNLLQTSFHRTRANLYGCWRVGEDFPGRGSNQISSQQDVSPAVKHKVARRSVSGEKGQKSFSCSGVSLTSSRGQSPGLSGEGEEKDASLERRENGISVCGSLRRSNGQEAFVEDDTSSPVRPSAFALPGVSASVLSVNGTGGGSSDAEKPSTYSRRRGCWARESPSPETSAFLSGGRHLLRRAKEEEETAEARCGRRGERGRGGEERGGGGGSCTTIAFSVNGRGREETVADFTAVAAPERSRRDDRGRTRATVRRNEKSRGREEVEKAREEECLTWGLFPCVVERTRVLSECLERTPLTPCDLHRMSLEEGIACIGALWMKPWLRVFDDACWVLKKVEGGCRKDEAGANGKGEGRSEREAEQERLSGTKKKKDGEVAERSRRSTSVIVREEERETAENRHGGKRGRGSDHPVGSCAEDPEERRPRRDSLSSGTTEDAGRGRQGQEERQDVVGDFPCLCRRSSATSSNGRSRVPGRSSSGGGMVRDEEKQDSERKRDSADATRGEWKSVRCHRACQSCGGFLRKNQGRGVLRGPAQNEDDGEGRVTDGQHGGTYHSGGDLSGLLQENLHLTSGTTARVEFGSGVGPSCLPTESLQLTGAPKTRDSQSRLEELDEACCRPDAGACCDFPQEAVLHCANEKRATRNVEGRTGGGFSTSQAETGMSAACLSCSSPRNDRPSLPSRMMFLNAYHLVHHFGDTERGASALRALYADTLEAWLRKHVQRILDSLVLLSASPPGTGDLKTHHNKAGLDCPSVGNGHRNEKIIIAGTNSPCSSQVPRHNTKHRDIPHDTPTTTTYHSAVPSSFSSSSSSSSSLPSSSSSVPSSGRGPVRALPLPRPETASPSPSLSQRSPPSVPRQESRQSGPQEMPPFTSSTLQRAGCLCCLSLASPPLHNSTGSTSHPPAPARSSSSSPGFPSAASPASHPPTLRIPVRRCTGQQCNEPNNPSLLGKVPLPERSPSRSRLPPSVSSCPPSLSSSLPSHPPVNLQGRNRTAFLTVSSHMSSRGKVTRNDSSTSASSDSPHSSCRQSKALFLHNLFSSGMLSKAASHTGKLSQDQGAIDTLRLRVGSDIRLASCFLRCFVDLWQAYGGLVHSLLKCMACLEILSPVPKGVGRSLVQTALHLFEVTAFQGSFRLILIRSLTRAITGYRHFLLARKAHWMEPSVVANSPGHSALLPPSADSECFPTSQQFSVLGPPSFSPCSPSSHRGGRGSSPLSFFSSATPACSVSSSSKRSAEATTFAKNRQQETAPTITTASMRSSSSSSSSSPPDLDLPVSPQSWRSMTCSPGVSMARSRSLGQHQARSFGVSLELFRSVLYVLACLSSPEQTRLVERRLSSVPSSECSAPLSPCCRSIAERLAINSHLQTPLPRPLRGIALNDSADSECFSSSSSYSQTNSGSPRKDSNRGDYSGTCSMVVSACPPTRMREEEVQREQEKLYPCTSDDSTYPAIAMTSHHAPRAYREFLSASVARSEGTRFAKTARSGEAEQSEEGGQSCVPPRIHATDEKKQDGNEDPSNFLYDDGEVIQDRSGFFRVGSRLVAWKSVYLGGYDELIEAFLCADASASKKRPFLLPGDFLVTGHCETRGAKEQNSSSFSPVSRSTSDPPANAFHLQRRSCLVTAAERKKEKDTGQSEEQLKGTHLASSPCLLEEREAPSCSSSSLPREDKQQDNRPRANLHWQRKALRRPDGGALGYSPKVSAIRSVMQLFALDLAHWWRDRNEKEIRRNLTEARVEEEEEEEQVLEKQKAHGAQSSRQPAQAYYYCKRIWNDLYAAILQESEAYYRHVAHEWRRADLFFGARNQDHTQCGGSSASSSSSSLLSLKDDPSPSPQSPHNCTEKELIRRTREAEYLWKMRAFRYTEQVERLFEEEDALFLCLGFCKRLRQAVNTRGVQACLLSSHPSVILRCIQGFTSCLFSRWSVLASGSFPSKEESSCGSAKQDIERKRFRLLSGASRKQRDADEMKCGDGVGDGQHGGEVPGRQETYSSLPWSRGGSKGGGGGGEKDSETMERRRTGEAVLGHCGSGVKTTEHHQDRESTRILEKDAEREKRRKGGSFVSADGKYPTDDCMQWARNSQEGKGVFLTTLSTTQREDAAPENEDITPDVGEQRERARRQAPAKDIHCSSSSSSSSFSFTSKSYEEDTLASVKNFPKGTLCSSANCGSERDTSRSDDVLLFSRGSRSSISFSCVDCGKSSQSRRGAGERWEHERLQEKQAENKHSELRKGIDNNEDSPPRQPASLLSSTEDTLQVSSAARHQLCLEDKLRHLSDLLGCSYRLVQYYDRQKSYTVSGKPAGSSFRNPLTSLFRDALEQVLVKFADHLERERDRRLPGGGRRRRRIKRAGQDGEGSDGTVEPLEVPNNRKLLSVDTKRPSPDSLSPYSETALIGDEEEAARAPSLFGSQEESLLATQSTSASSQSSGQSDRQKKNNAVAIIKEEVQKERAAVESDGDEDTTEKLVFWGLVREFLRAIYNFHVLLVDAFQGDKTLKQVAHEVVGRPSVSRVLAEMLPGYWWFLLSENLMDQWEGGHRAFKERLATVYFAMMTERDKFFRSFQTLLTGQLLNWRGRRGGGKALGRTRDFAGTRRSREDLLKVFSMALYTKGLAETEDGDSREDARRISTMLEDIIGSSILSTSFRDLLGQANLLQARRRGRQDHIYSWFHPRLSCQISSSSCRSPSSSMPCSPSPSAPCSTTSAGAPDRASSPSRLLPVRRSTRKDSTLFRGNFVAEGERSSKGREEGNSERTTMSRDVSGDDAPATVDGGHQFPPALSPMEAERPSEASLPLRSEPSLDRLVEDADDVEEERQQVTGGVRVRLRERKSVLSTYIPPVEVKVLRSNCWPHALERVCLEGECERVGGGGTAVEVWSEEEDEVPQTYSALDSFIVCPPSADRTARSPYLGSISATTSSSSGLAPGFPHHATVLSSASYSSSSVPLAPNSGFISCPTAPRATAPPPVSSPQPVLVQTGSVSSASSSSWQSGVPVLSASDSSVSCPGPARPQESASSAEDQSLLSAACVPLGVVLPSPLHLAKNAFTAFYRSRFPSRRLEWRLALGEVHLLCRWKPHQQASRRTSTERLFFGGLSAGALFHEDRAVGKKKGREADGAVPRGPCKVASAGSTRGFLCSEDRRKARRDSVGGETEEAISLQSGPSSPASQYTSREGLMTEVSREEKVVEVRLPPLAAVVLLQFDETCTGACHLASRTRCPQSTTTEEERKEEKDKKRRSTSRRRISFGRLRYSTGLSVSDLSDALLTLAQPSCPFLRVAAPSCQLQKAACPAFSSSVSCARPVESGSSSHAQQATKNEESISFNSPPNSPEHQHMPPGKPTDGEHDDVLEFTSEEKGDSEKPRPCACFSSFSRGTPFCVECLPRTNSSFELNLPWVGAQDQITRLYNHRCEQSPDMHVRRQKAPSTGPPFYSSIAGTRKPRFQKKEKRICVISLPWLSRKPSRERGEVEDKKLNRDRRTSPEEREGGHSQREAMPKTTDGNEMITPDNTEGQEQEDFQNEDLCGERRYILDAAIVKSLKRAGDRELSVEEIVIEADKAVRAFKVDEDAVKKALQRLVEREYIAMVQKEDQQQKQEATGCPPPTPLVYYRYHP